MMVLRHIIIIFSLSAVLGTAVYFYILRNWDSEGAESNENRFALDENLPTSTKDKVDVIDNSHDEELVPPLDRAWERVTKKPFGIMISPQNSPVSPERFSGYHTAIDLEVFDDEIDKEVQISAVCRGKLLSKRMASGYGGVAVQSCELKKEPITVIYGHLKLSSIGKNIGENIEKGENIGILGKGYSLETDNERKHLHLGIHKGSSVNILGYIRNEAGLSAWIDPCLYFCR